MFRKQDFQKLDLLGSGKKNTKIYKVQHLQTGKIYVLKEIEAKTLDKLNEYKEEAVQLSKVQNHPNIIKFFGYYFSETMYHTFRLGLITEFMDQQQNLENMYRKKKKLNQFWKESDLVAILFSLISSCSFLQQRGICHRDIKPANLFLQPNGEVKLIDFGESKDYFYDPNDESKNTYTVATIRGTPQYLSPVLWKAHVIDGSSRYVEHNIYKSDVFSSGLVMFQLALMQEVTGYNNKTAQTEGEVLIKQNLIEIEKMYSPQFVNIIALMLIFEESNRPSYLEIEQLFIEHENQAREAEGIKNPDEKPKKMNEYIRLYNLHYNSLLKRGGGQVNSSTYDINTTGFASSLYQTQQLNNNSNTTNTFNNETQSFNQNDTNNKHLTQKNTDSFKKPSQNIKKENLGQFYKETTLILHESCYWFEFGGITIGKFSIHKQRWKQQQNPDKQPFPYHFITLYIPEFKAYYLLGGKQGQNFRIFQNGKVVMNKSQIPTFRNFFPAVYFNRKIWVFGGYEGNAKTQLKSCEVYDFNSCQWSPLPEMNVFRSQAAACKLNDNQILVFGGYNKDQGTLDSIERFNINENKWELLKCKIPLPLRRFMVVRVAKNLALILGGLTKCSKESQKVFKFDNERQEIIEMENLEKGGVIESEVLVDNDDYLHIFLEHANGTTPHSHIKYFFDPKATQYITKQE